MGSDDFDKTMAGQFSMTESQVGTEMYQVMIEHNKAIAEHIYEMAMATKMHAAMSIMRTVFSVVLATLVFIPAYFFLWKAILRW